MTFGNRLRTLRLEAGMSQEQLGTRYLRVQTIAFLKTSKF